jgi:hypothetical protein
LHGPNAVEEESLAWFSNQAVFSASDGYTLGYKRKCRTKSEITVCPKKPW